MDFSLPSTPEHSHGCLLPEGRKGSSTRKMVGKFCIRETSSREKQAAVFMKAPNKTL